MSQYLIDQLGTRANIEVAFGIEVAAVHGDGSLAEIDLREVTSEETSRVGSSGLFIFIGADAETEWLPDVALHPRGYVLTGPEMRAAADWPLDRNPFLLETSVPGIFRLRRRPLRPSQASGRRSRRRQHVDRLRPPVPAITEDQRGPRGGWRLGDHGRTLTLCPPKAEAAATSR